jgi:transmembrane sensor
MTAEASEDLWNEAFALLLRWQDAPEDVAARDAVRQFCAQGAGHRAAWDEARRVHHLSGQATRIRQKQAGRRRVLAGVGATALLAAGGAMAPGTWRQWRNDATTETAEIARHALPDGSWLTLGARSAVRLAFSASGRMVELTGGAAFVEVASAPGPPFQGRAGELEAIGAEGTFELRQEADRSLVAVASGRFEGRADSRPGEPFWMDRGDWLTTGPFERGRQEDASIAPWRRGLLIADRQEIRSLVAQIQRWHPGRIIILEDRLAQARVSGLYDLRETGPALQAIVRPYGGRIRQISPWLTILSAG